MRTIALLLLAACSSEGQKPAPPPPPTEPPPWAPKEVPLPPPRDPRVDAPWDLTPAEREAVSKADAHEHAQTEIVDSLNALFTTGGVKNVIATADEEDLMIVAPPGECDGKVLRDLRKSLVAFELDPAKAFATMQCNGGPVLKLKR